MSKRPASEFGADLPPAQAAAKAPRVDHMANGNSTEDITGVHLGHSDHAQPRPQPVHPGGQRPRPDSLPPRDSTRAIYYKGEEPLKGLARIWKSQGDKSPLVEVVIIPEFLTSANKQVRGRQIWGDGIYTDDSDLVAVIMHLGYYPYELPQPPSQIYEIRVQLKLLPPQEMYVSKFRNAVRSRAWCGKIDGCSYKVEKCWVVTRNHTTITLEPSLTEAGEAHTTFIPGVLDRQISTRSSTSAAGRNRMLQEVTMQYSLCNEPWLKYSMGSIADRGLKPSQWTSARIQEEVLYFETECDRYEICYVDTHIDGKSSQEVYRFSRVLKPAPLAVMKKEGVPLDDAGVEVIQAQLYWEDFKWGSTTLVVKDVEYTPLRIHFFPITKLDTAESS